MADATGRESKASQWLKSLGYTPPSETISTTFFGYTSRIYVPSLDPQRKWKGMVIQPDPPGNLRGGVIWPTEQGYWMVVLSGVGKDYHPTDNDAFLTFAKSLSPSYLRRASELTVLSSHPASIARDILSHTIGNPALMGMKHPASPPVASLFTAWIPSCSPFSRRVRLVAWNDGMLNCINTIH